MIICQMCGDVIGTPGLPRPQERDELVRHRERHRTGELPERSAEAVLQAYEKYERLLVPQVDDSDRLEPLVPTARSLAQSLASDLVAQARASGASSVLVGVTLPGVPEGSTAQFWLQYWGDVPQLRQLGLQAVAQTSCPTLVAPPSEPVNEPLPPKDVS